MQNSTDWKLAAAGGDGGITGDLIYVLLGGSSLKSAASWEDAPTPTPAWAVRAAADGTTRLAVSLDTGSDGLNIHDGWWGSLVWHAPGAGGKLRLN